MMPMAIIAAFGLFVGFAPTVGAQSALGNACEADPSATICQNQNDSAGDVINVVVNTLLFIVGIISVIMIIVGGIMYATSAGDSGQVTKAKNTILFSVIGLAVAFFAFAIVNWVVARFV